MEDNKDEEMKKTSYRAILYRGSIINLFIGLEDFMNNIICIYFCSDDKKADELKYRLVADSLDFEKKLNLLAFIIKNGYPKFEAKNPTLISDIRSLSRTRNIVAHRHIMVVENDPLEKRSKEVNFATPSVEDHKMKVKNTAINDEELNKILEKCKKAIDTLETLYTYLLAGITE